MLGSPRVAVNEIARRAGGWRVVVWGVLLAVLAVVLDFVPLFNLLGYDFSFAVGLVAAFAGVDIGHGVVAAARRRQGTPLLAGAAWALAGRGVARGLGVLVLPLALSLANALRVKNCNITVGLGFFALLPLATMVFAAPAGVLAGLALPRRGRLIAWLLPVGSLALTLARLYRDPAVFAFDPFGGYFPGPIYDEALRPPLRLLYYRAANVVWMATAVAAAAILLDGQGVSGVLRLGIRRPRPLGLAVAALLLAGSAVLYGARGRAGFHVTAADLQRVLPGERRSEHFVLRYAGDSDRAGGVELDLMMADLEFRYHQLREILGVEPDGRITVYQFPSAAAKKDAVGAATTLYAKPWTREVFLHAERFPASRVRHELAHVFAGAFGDPVFGVSLAWRWWGLLPIPVLATGLIEGVAEAAAWGDRDTATTTHEDAAAIIAENRAPPLQTVVGAGFSALSGARAYTLAGSFCRFLLTSRGAGSLRKLYRSAGDFQRVYGSSLADLETQWRSFLGARPLTDTARAAAAERFRQPAIFRQVCARELAVRTAQARGLIRTQPAEAVELLRGVCRDDPNEPLVRLDLGEALAAAGQTSQALDLLAAVERNTAYTEPVRARAAALASSVSFHAGDVAGAAAAIRRALERATDEGERRSARVKLRALADDDARRTLARALYGDGPSQGLDPVVAFSLIADFVRLSPHEALGHYLLGRQLAGREPRLALPPLGRACGGAGTGEAAAPLPEGFLRECLRLTGEASYRAGEMGRARKAYQRLRDTAEAEADRLRADDFIDRIRWENAGTGSVPRSSSEAPTGGPPAARPAPNGSSKPE